MTTQLSECCISGHVHEGTPKGVEDHRAGLDTYIVGEKDSAKALVFVADVFGWKLPNIRLLADEYAAQGYLVFVPDVFQNDPVPMEYMKTLTPLNSDPQPSDEEKGAVFAKIGPWMGRQSDEKTLPLLERFLKALRTHKNIKKVAGVGFCWGAVKVLQLAKGESLLDAVVAHHPSFASFPAIFEEVEKPSLITCGDADSMFPFDQVKEVRDWIFPTKQGSRVIVFPAAPHGFACRGDQNNDEERKLKEDANNAAIKFLAQVLI